MGNFSTTFANFIFVTLLVANIVFNSANFVYMSTRLKVGNCNVKAVMVVSFIFERSFLLKMRKKIRLTIASEKEFLRLILRVSSDADEVLWAGYDGCREEENLVFWFGAQFISTLNFNQSGWLIQFSPDLHFRPPKLVSCQTQSLWLGNADQNRRSLGRSYLAMLLS